METQAEIEHHDIERRRDAFREDLLRDSDDDEFGGTTPPSDVPSDVPPDVPPTVLTG